VCLIRKRRSAKWGIPKGVIDPGETAAETALKEAWEEAGIAGRLLGRPVGAYVHEKWGAALTVAVYVMHVESEHPSWPEMRLRDREWVSWAEAMARLARHPVRPLLGRAARRLEARRV
jgi:8-oxo-dGTP pyrophosphatase MutT (NUDIX family)